MDKAWSAAAGALVVATLAQGVGAYVDTRLSAVVLMLGAVIFVAIARRVGASAPMEVA